MKTVVFDLASHFFRFMFKTLLPFTGFGSIITQAVCHRRANRYTFSIGGKMISKSKYEMLAVIGGFLLMFTTLGIICNCFSLSIVPNPEDLGFSRGSYAVSQTLMFAFSAVFSLINAKIYKKVDIIKTVRIGVIIETAVFFAQSYATEVWMFYISYAILGFSMSMTTTLPVGLLINEWIDVNANTFIGIAMMGSGLGGAVFNPILNSLITSGGWQYAYRIMAIIILVLSLPAACLMLKRNPAALAKAAEKEPDNPETEAAAPQSSAKIPFLQKRIVLFALVLAVGNGISAALNFAINPHIRDLGYSASFASICSSIEMGVMAVGKMVFGRILDKKGAKVASFCCYAGTAASLISLAFFREPLVLFIALINLGLFFGCPIGTVGAVAFAKEAVGERDMAAFVGPLQCYNTLGSTVAPLLLGNTYDIFGSYTPLLIALAIMLVVATPLIPLAFRAKLITKKA